MTLQRSEYICNKRQHVCQLHVKLLCNKNRIKIKNKIDQFNHTALKARAKLLAQNRPQMTQMSQFHCYKKAKQEKVQ